MFAGIGSVQQAAALPFRSSSVGYELLFVSTRRRGRWVLPKGWPRKGEALCDTAAREAQEEAGVDGHVSQQAFGSYRYRKRMRQGYDVPCEVVVFPFLVACESTDWSEAGLRERRWCVLAAAPGLCDEPDLVRVLETLVSAGGDVLADLFVNRQAVESSAPGSPT